MTIYTERDLNENIKKNNFFSIYFFEGQELYMQSYFAEKILEKLMPNHKNDMNFIQIDGEKFEVDELIDKSNSISFSFSEKKIIYVKNLDVNILNKDELNKFIIFLNESHENLIIIFYHTIQNKNINSSIKKMLTSNNIIYCNFLIKTDIELARLIRSYCAKNNTEITPNAVNNLILYCSSNLLEIINQLEKLCVYANGNVINENTIEKLVDKNIDVSIYLIAKNLQAKNLTLALNTLDTLLKNKVEALYILNVISSLYYDIFVAKLAGQQNKYLDDIAIDLLYAKNTTFRIKNSISLCEKYTFSNLQLILNILILADIQLKSTNINPKHILQISIIKIFTEVIDA